MRLKDMSSREKCKTILNENTSRTVNSGSAGIDYVKIQEAVDREEAGLPVFHLKEYALFRFMLSFIIRGRRQW